MKCKQALQRHDMPLSADEDVADLLGAQEDVRTWRNCGMPCSQTATTNALIMSCASKWLLLVDIHGQAPGWIRKRYAATVLVQLGPQDTDCAARLQAAVLSGKPVLLEQVDLLLAMESDGSLLRTLAELAQKQPLYSQARPDFVTDAEPIGGKVYMTTTSANPMLPWTILRASAVVTCELPDSDLDEAIFWAIATGHNATLAKQRNFKQLSGVLSYCRQSAMSHVVCTTPASRALVL